LVLCSAGSGSDKGGSLWHFGIAVCGILWSSKWQSPEEVMDWFLSRCKSPELPGCTDLHHVEILAQTWTTKRITFSGTKPTKF